MLAAEGDDFLSVRCPAMTGHYEGFHAFTGKGIWHTDHCSFSHLWMQVENLFDVAWVHVETTRQDDFLLAVHNIEKPVLIHTRDVPGIEPAIAQHLGGVIRVTPVAL